MWPISQLWVHLPTPPITPSPFLAPKLLHTYPPEQCPFSPFYLCICTCYTFCRECYFPSLFPFQFSAQKYFPPKKHSLCLVKSPLPPQGRLQSPVFPWRLEGRTTPLYSSTPSTMYVQKHLLMNEWIGNNICLSFWGLEPWWRARKLEGILQI